MDSLARALDSWTNLLGAEAVVTADSELRLAETATFQTRSRIPAIIRPASREQVQECLRVANRERVPVYPVSGGRNWGYGSRVPPVDGNVVIDLGRMNRIRELNEELGYVSVEPGVTQKQLQDHLRVRTSGRLWIDGTASSPASSLIGNLLERGHGVTPYCDHVATACGMEVVLPSGELIHTGYSAFPGSKAAALDRWGLGPSLDGLFSQSNLGIVTAASIWLMPAPARLQVCYFSMSGDEDLESTLDALRPLRLDGTIRSGPHIGNVYLGLLRMMSYPWDRTGGRTPLALDTARALMREQGLGAWNGAIGLYGSRAQVASQRRLLRRALRRTTQTCVFLGETLMSLTRWLPARRLGVARKVFGAFRGEVTAVGLPRAYWRMRSGPSAPNPEEIDLDRDRCGFLYCTAVSPFTGRDARRASDLISQRILRHGFEPSIGIFPIRDRCLHFHVSIPYDRSMPGHDEAALACHDDVLAALMSEGFYPHRLGVNSMPVMSKVDPTYGALLSALKHALDPQGILAPGRYIP